MKVTNHTSRPSERLILCIEDYFKGEGFTYHKSKKSFTRPFAHGIQTVGFWFRISTLTSVEMNWNIRFDQLEKALSKLKGERFSQSASTIGTSLSNHTRWEKGVEDTFDLYDAKTLHYDDFSINAAAEKVIAAYKKYVVPYFETYNSFEAVEKYFNQLDWKTLKGIMLAVYLDTPDSDNLIKELVKQAHLRSDGKSSEELDVINKVLRAIQDNTLKHLMQ